MSSSREAPTDAGGHELRGLELLRDHESLLLPAASGLVVARESEDDDQSEENRKPCSQHAEYARSAVAVLEVASLRRAAPHEQHRPDRNGGRGRDDEHGPDEVHGG